MRVPGTTGRPLKRRGCPSLTGSPSSFLFFSTLSVSFLPPPGLPRCNCCRAAQHSGLRRRITPVMLVDAQRRRKRRGSHQWICHDDHTACITTDATERPAPRYASESLPAEPRRLDALARHFRMSCARYHCYSQRRPGGSFVRRRQWQRRCTSRDIILRSPVACTAHHELPGSPSSAPARASRRVGRRNQASRPRTRSQRGCQRRSIASSDTPRADKDACAPTLERPPGCRQEVSRPPRRASSRSASSEDGPCFALFDLCLCAISLRAHSEPGAPARAGYAGLDHARDKIAPGRRLLLC